MIVLISPSKEMNDHARVADQRPVLYEYAMTLAVPEDFTTDLATYQALDLYDGLQFRYLKKGLDQSAWRFLGEHLRILSACYGVVRPFDGIRRYRKDFTTRGLYQAWGDRIYQALHQEGRTFLNLASDEYAKTVRRYIQEEDQMIDVAFYEQEADGTLKKHSTISKKGRGQLVNYLARTANLDLAHLKQFNDLDYQYDSRRSTQSEWVFVRPRDQK